MKVNLRLLAIVTLGSAALLGTSPLLAKTRQTNQASQRQAEYERKLEDLEQRQKILERNIELDAEKKKEEDKQKVIAGAGQNGFYLKSADGKYVLKFRGYIQADARFYFNDTPTTPPDTFIARRIRPILEGSLTKYFDFKFMPDFGSGQVTIQDAYFDSKVMPEFKIRVGKFKEPVGLERLQSATNLTFVERAFPTSLVPNRDLGIQLFGEFFGGVLTYEAGVFNGVPDGASANFDSNGAKDFAGRVFTHPFRNTSIKPLQKLGIGIAGTIGEQDGNAKSPNLPTYLTAGQQTFFSYVNDGTTPGTTVADGERFRISPQGYFYYGPFGLLWEYVLSSQRVTRLDQTANVANQAWQLALSYVILGGDATYKELDPKKPLGWVKKGTGAFELAARYSELDIDEDAFPIFADPSQSAEKARSWAIDFNWYLNKNAKFMLTYEQTSFNGGAADGGDRTTEKILFNRYQISF